MNYGYGTGSVFWEMSDPDRIYLVSDPNLVVRTGIHLKIAKSYKKFRRLDLFF